MSRPRIAVTLGDPRGIGPEVTARALADPLDAEVTVIGPDDLTAGVPAADRVGVGAWEVTGETGPLSSHEQAIRAGTLAGRAVERAAALALSGEVHAICTAPIDKWALRLAGFAWPGHTEMLGHLAGGAEPAMMLAAEPLRVVLLTVHVALRDVPALLTVDRVVRIGEIARKGLREWFGIASPRLAVCALNPHAGERGLFGDEEARVLEPAARRLEAAGPLSADTVFVRALRGEFDAVLAPYHDVGMTAVKVAAFGRGVNVTLGLPFPRTSPDHGTAIDLAGRGLADPSSMRQALEMAVRLARRR